MAMVMNLHDPLQSRLLVIQEELRSALGGVPGLPQGMSEELLKEPNRNLCGLLVLLFADAVKARTDEAHLAAVSMEMLRVGLKVQEAAEEGASLTRGHLLAGSFLQTQALSLCADLPPSVMQPYAELCKHLLAEKARRRERAVLPELSDREYLERAYSRFALYAATCGKVGARLGDAASEIEEGLTAYGYSLGMALQVQEDLVLLKELPARAGRSVMRKMTVCGMPLPLRSARLLIRSYTTKAKQCLSVLPPSFAKCLLLDLTNALFEQSE
jgi:geranylgeranyl pyrophosphate synthase